MAASTQQSIPIAGIKDGVIILKNGAYRMVLSVSAVNFSLKSEQEQNSLVFQYQSFLNSLHFPIEIVIRSKKLDLDPYLNKVKKASENSLNDLIRVQITDYVDFVSKLISIANIMKKSFYVVVPYEPISIKKLNILDSLFAKTQTFDHLKIADTEFKSATDQLKERGDIIASGLASMGLHCFQLSTEEIVEMFYQIYNPDEAGKERIDDASKISAKVVISEGEAKQAEPGSAIEPPENNNFERAIDNASMVEEQQKQAAQIRRQESSREAERQERAPEAAPAAQANPPAQPQAVELPPVDSQAPQPTINQQNTTTPNGQ